MTGIGGPEKLELRDVPPPRPGPDELLVDVSVAGVNFRDIYEREDRGKPDLVVGIEGAGTVVGTGARVGWVNAQGSYAEQVAVPAEQAVPLPDTAADEVAAAVLLQRMTAHYLCPSTYPVRPGRWAG